MNVLAILGLEKVPAFRLNPHSARQNVVHKDGKT